MRVLFRGVPTIAATPKVNTHPGVPKRREGGGRGKSDRDAGKAAYTGCDVGPPLPITERNLVLRVCNVVWCAGGLGSATAGGCWGVGGCVCGGMCVDRPSPLLSGIWSLGCGAWVWGCGSWHRPAGFPLQPLQGLRSDGCRFGSSPSSFFLGYPTATTCWRSTRTTGPPKTVIVRSPICSS